METATRSRSSILQRFRFSIRYRYRLFHWAIQEAVRPQWRSVQLESGCMLRAAETMRWPCWNEYVEAHCSGQAAQSPEERCSDYADTCLWTGIPWHSQLCLRMTGRKQSSPQTQREPGHTQKQEGSMPGQISPVLSFHSQEAV